MIGLIGISYKTAPVEIRGQYAFTSDEIENFSSELKHQFDAVGSIIVSTCNRTEIYFQLKTEEKSVAFENVLDILKKIKNFSNSHRKNFYFLSGFELVRQVKDSFAVGQKMGFSTPVLTRLFQKSFEIGKKIRTETNINNGASSVSSAAVEMCSTIFPKASDKTILLVGTGKTGQLSIEYLYKKGYRNIYIANRTFSKAADLAAIYNGKAIELNTITEILAQCDIVIAATNSTEYLITKAMVESKISDRNGKKQLFIDLSVPHNIDPSLKMIQSVQLSDVDTLESVIKNNNLKRKEAVSEAAVMIQEAYEEFRDSILWFLNFFMCRKKT